MRCDIATCDMVGLSELVRKNDVKRKKKGKKEQEVKTNLKKARQKTDDDGKK